MNSGKKKGAASAAKNAAPELNYTTYYTANGHNIAYARAAVSIVKSPYSGEYEIAVKPFYDKNGAFADLYSYEDDIKYSHFLTVVRDCELSGKEIPAEIDSFIREMMKKKREQNDLANGYLRARTGDSTIEVDFPLNRWREGLVYDPKVRELLEEFKKTHK